MKTQRNQMIPRICILIFIIIVFINPVHADDNIDNLNSEMQTSNFEPFNNRGSIRFYTGYRNAEISIEGKNDNKTKINYEPANKIFIIGSDFEIFDLNFSASSSINNRDQTDFQFNYFGRRLCLDVIYQYYKDYKTTIKNNDPDNYFEYVGNRENSLYYKNYGFNIYYNFSSSFSLKAAFDQSERQKEGTLSFLIMFSTNVMEIHSDNYLIPNEQSELFGKEKGFKGGKFITFTPIPIPGGGFCSSKNNAFYTVAFFVGPTYQYQKYNVDGQEITNKHLKPIGKIHSKAAAGYNGDKLFFGAKLFIDQNLYSTKEIDITSTSVNITFFAGIRF